ncbi:MAG TPA: 50S ribosomal protein L28 [bacterium]|nr:50S ribosomal protein L28 [bacterium]
MSRKCEICGKKPQFGHNVSHANNKTQKIQNPNVQKIKIKAESGQAKRANVCTRCLRSGKIQKAI